MSTATICSKITKSVRCFWSAVVRTPFQLTGKRSITEKETIDRKLVAEDIGQKYQLSNDVLSEISRRMSRAMDVGTPSRCPLATTIRCWDTHIAYPTTTNSQVNPKAIGQYLNLELLDGEHIRTRFTAVSDTNDLLVWSETYRVPYWMRIGTGRQLIDQASNYLANFAKHLGVRTAGIPLVFSFGFPVQQTALNAAVLYRSTKEYDCADLVGHDVVAELRRSLSRFHVQIGPVVVLNDASTVMLDCMTDDPNTHVGIVVDNGCNCCYVERAVDVCGYVEPSSPAANTIVNTEWGAFGEDGVLNFVQTKHDIGLDIRSRKPGKQIFEKMTSGMYMAELVREMLLEMIERKALFNGNVPSKMNMEYTLKAKHLFVVESDVQKQYRGGREVLANVFGVTEPTDLDCELFRYACNCVTRRSAHLVAAGLSSVLRRLKSNAMADAPHTTVAVGGSVLRRHRKYVSLMQSMTQSLTADDEIKFTFRTIDENRNGLLVSGLLAKMLLK